MINRVYWLIAMSGLLLLAHTHSYAFTCADTETTGIPEIECEALIALQAVTHEEHCKGNWNTPVSDWHDIKTRNGHIVELHWRVCKLHAIPVELGNLTQLEVLDLSANRSYVDGVVIRQKIPAELGNLINLRELYISQSYLFGSIPPELGNLTQLEILDLYFNDLNGNIPAELGNLTQLKELDLSVNQLSGEIPAKLGNLTQLKELDLSANELSGEIPAELGNLTQLKALKLSSNELSREIPAELGDLINLRFLYLGGNQLSGSIPAELANLTQLRGLYLGGNQLSGEMPAELGNLIELLELHLSGNQLSGSIPAELGNLTQLINFGLSGNRLTGSIPAELGNLIQLQKLYLNENQLSGEMPAELGNLINLVWLYLSDNQLSGSIPTELGHLPWLRKLKLNNNQLRGGIPESFNNLDGLVSLDLSNNYLSGDSPSANLVPLLKSMPGTINIHHNCLKPTDPTIRGYLDWKNIKKTSFGFGISIAGPDWYTTQDQCTSPATCQLYAVHDAGLNNSQFITINPADLTSQTLGNLYAGDAIEALAIHHENNNLYAVTGAVAAEADYLYQIDGVTGEHAAIGATGFTQIQDLTFSSDGTLYAWVTGRGIVEINLTTGQGTLIVPSSHPVKSLTLSKQAGSTIFYGIVDSELWRYNLTTGALDVLCSNLSTDSEALEVLNEQALLVGTHEVNFGIYMLNLETCEFTFADEVFSNPFKHVEGLAMPVAACQ